MFVVVLTRGGVNMAGSNVRGMRDLPPNVQGGVERLSVSTIPSDEAVKQAHDLLRRMAQAQSKAERIKVEEELRAWAEQQQFRLDNKLCAKCGNHAYAKEADPDEPRIVGREPTKRFYCRSHVGGVRKSNAKRKYAAVEDEKNEISARTDAVTGLATTLSSSAQKKRKLADKVGKDVALEIWKKSEEVVDRVMNPSSSLSQFQSEPMDIDSPSSIN